MSDQLRVLLVGASGLVGREVIARTIGREDVRLLGLSRRELDLPRGARIEVLLADPEGWDEAIHAIGPKHVICALGTTRSKQGGDEEAFAAVDRDLVVRVATVAKEAGARGFTVISSVGADAQSANFYLRTKGEMENRLMKMGFSRLDVLRPGLLRGERKNDLRPVEKLGMIISRLLDMFMFGEKRKYRSIPASEVAAAALQSCREKAPGRFVYQHDGILRLSRKLPAAAD